MTESLLIPQYYTPPTVEPCPKCGAVHWTHTDMGQGYDRMRCNECHTAIWGFAGVIPAEPALDTWNALSKERQRLQAELDATKDKLAKAVDALELADNNLTNLQPKIANGLVRSDWVPVFDGYIDPVIQAARAALTQKDTVHD